MIKKIEGIPPPWLPWDWSTKANASKTLAIQALDRGEASAEQQKLVLSTILEISGYYDLSYRPNSDRDTAFAEGMRFVGSTLVKLTKVIVNINFQAEDEYNERSRRKPG